MGRKLIAVLLLVWVLSLMTVTAFAQDFDPDRVGSVCVTMRDQSGSRPIADAEVSLYRVATVSLNSKGKLSYVFTAAFENCGCALDDPTLSAKLDAFVAEHAVSAVKLATDRYGKANFTNVSPGLYFVKQTGASAGYARSPSFLVAVPQQNASGYVYDVTAAPKTDVVRLADITVRKVWNTGAASQAANSVTVQLLRNGSVVETATLNEQNHWQITYPNMPQSDLYSIVEVNVPKGFTATYSQSGYVFTVTNTASLAQTGQLVWPIPVLAMAGLFLIVVGSIVLRKTRKENA